MEFFRARRKEVIIAPVFGKAEVSMARLSCAYAGHGLIDPHHQEDAFFLAFNLRDYSGDLWVDGRRLERMVSRRGNFTIYDYRRTWTADMRSSFDGLGFHFPRSALIAFEEDLGGKCVDTLNARPGRDIEDDVVRRLVYACLPALENPESTSRLFQDHVAALLTFHLCTTYGAPARRVAPAGALSPWQETRAADLLLSDLSADVGLSTIAAACELSQGHFVRAFKASFGHPPHRWLVLKRIETAKDLLRSTKLSVAEIALRCGFFDQAHLTRTFSTQVGTTPSKWRRASR